MEMISLTAEIVELSHKKPEASSDIGEKAALTDFPRQRYSKSDDPDGGNGGRHEGPSSDSALRGTEGNAGSGGSGSRRPWPCEFSPRSLRSMGYSHFVV